MQIYEALSKILGLNSEPKDITFLQMSLRAVIVFIAAIIIMRVANKRFMSKMSSLDAVLGFALASVLARAINGSAAFFPTIGCSFLLVILHRLFAALGFYSNWFESLVKGEADQLVKEGKKNASAMRKNRITDKDLMEELRLNGNTCRLDVESATLERSGEISVVNKD